MCFHVVIDQWLAERKSALCRRNLMWFCQAVLSRFRPYDWKLVMALSSRQSVCGGALSELANNKYKAYVQSGHQYRVPARTIAACPIVAISLNLVFRTMANTATRHSHGRLRLSKTQKVSSVIIIASAFFIVEIAIGIKTRSLALIADAFHIFSDLLGYIAAWIAIRMSTSAKTAQFTYGYQRGEILGGFFNGGKYDGWRLQECPSIDVVVPLFIDQPSCLH